MGATVSPLRSAKTPTHSPVWLSPAEVCERVPGMTETILSERRKNNLSPRYFKPSSKTVIYEQADIDEWVRSTASTPRR